MKIIRFFQGPQFCDNKKKMENKYWSFRRKYIPNKVISCALCKNTDLYRYSKAHLRYYIKRFSYYEEDPQVNLVICKKCGLIFENPQFSQEYYDFYYKDFYNNDIHDTKELDLILKFKSRIRISLLDPYIKKFNNPRILEIGSWDGTLLEEIKTKFPNAEIFGIEADKKLYEYSLKKYPILKDKISNSTLESFNFNKKEYDIIILGFVVRHFADPIGSLNKLKSLLSSKGYLYFDEGDDLFEMHNDHRNKDSLYWFSHQKRFYYSSQTFDLLLKKVELKLIQYKKLNLGLSINSPSFLCQMTNYKEKIPLNYLNGKHFLEVKKYLDRHMPKVNTFIRLKHYFKNRIQDFINQHESILSNKFIYLLLLTIKRKVL
jgi:SAM-dependent methyltransferase